MVELSGLHRAAEHTTSLCGALVHAARHSAEFVELLHHALAMKAGDYVMPVLMRIGGAIGWLLAHTIQMASAPLRSLNALVV